MFSMSDAILEIGGRKSKADSEGCAYRKKNVSSFMTLPDSVSFIDEIPLIGNLSIKRFRLGNGLLVAIVVDTTAPIFTYQTWFKTGSADEAPGRQGLAHLFEHMMFRKTSRRPMGEFDRLVNSNGGTGLNAYTSRDQTVYYFTFPNDKLGIAADLEADRMNNLIIDREMFETEKGAVLTEKNRGLDEPMRYLWEELYKLAYTSHTYKYSTIGETDTIKNFSVVDAETFYRNYYAPGNALIIVVGDLNPEAVMRTIAGQYGNLPGREPKKRILPAEPKQDDERFAELAHRKATQPMLAKAWHIPPITHNDVPALVILGKLLSSGKSALLNERLLYASKVTEVFADAYMSRDMGTFEFFAQLASDVPFEEVERVFATTVSELADGPISGDQMQVVKNATKREFYQSITSPASLAQKLGDGFIYADDLAYQIRAIERIDHVTPADVGRVIETYLHRAPSTTVRLTQNGHG